jgi:hypothetical protein
MLLAGAGAGALVLRDDDDPEPAADRTRTAAAETTTTVAAATTTVPAETAPPNPAVCLEGNYQVARMQYSGPVETVYGPAMLEGGEDGRTIEINADGTFAFHDTGAEDTKFSLTTANPPITGTAKLVADAGGTYTATATTVTTDVTSLSGTLTATTSDGQVLNIPLPPDAAGVEQTFGFTPDASYTCEGDTVTIQFQVLKLTLDRQ